MVVKAKDGNHYLLLEKDPGFPHPEDKGLWRAYRTEWNSRGEWEFNNDDVWMLTDDYKVVAREIGWGRRREEVK